MNVDFRLSAGCHTMKQLGTEYSFKNLHAHAIPDDILLNNDTIFDIKR